MKVRQYLTTAPTFHNHPIATDKAANIAWDTRVLEALERSMNNILAETGFCHLVRYRVTLPDDGPIESNKTFRKAQQEVVRYCTRRKLIPNYVAVKLDENTSQFDVAMFLDGRTDKKNDNAVLEQTKEIFKRKVELHGSDASQCFVQNVPIQETNILLYDKDDIDNAFHEGSKLAQTEYRPMGRTLFASPKKV